MIEFSSGISLQMQIGIHQVKQALKLFSEGATIPFIARYRKDVTGNLDEVQLLKIMELAKEAQELASRKTYILKTIEEAGQLTPQLKKSIEDANNITLLEDLFLPYKPKRKTRASIARERGLEPLAQLIKKQTRIEVLQEAKKYLSKDLPTVELVLAGARDIIAEEMSEHAALRNTMRNLYQREAIVQSKMVNGKETEGAKYRDYFSFTESLSKIPSHRMLAIFRGEEEGILRLGIEPNEERAHFLMEREFLFGNNESAAQVKLAIKDSYKRLLQPSLENEFRQTLKTRADEEAIQVFAENLRQLLLSSPLGSKKIMAIDPGYRSGCKVVCLDENGNLKHTSLIYIHEKNQKLTEAEHLIRTWVHEYKTEAFAIGNGTAGRETQQFIQSLQLNIPVFMVNEDGASIYSASAIGREEFPDYDLTVRGAVSIGRRLMDPLAELVKLDPKSIGVGQYQHDVAQNRLKERLDQTVEHCVNKVGVNLNTASKHLLSYVSGIGPVLAENIVNYRAENGNFTQRKQLLKVPRLGPKVYEQCAGFLKIPQSKNPLDHSTVHPEAYPLVERMAADLGLKLEQLICNEKVISDIKISQYANDKIGMHTIQDILTELRKPGLDPRSEVQLFEFAKIYKIEDVAVGMMVPGLVTNLTRFGAFVDIGVKQDGMVHISEIANQYITDPNQVLKLNQAVMVKVLEVDMVRKRISLSIKQAVTKQ